MPGQYFIPMPPWGIVVIQYPRKRKWALTGMILLPLLTLSGFIILEYIERRPSNKTIILIADFQGNDQKHATTQTVIDRMRRATSGFPEVQIIPLEKVITVQAGSAAAREEGSKHKAHIVVWGFYDEFLNGTVHIELMHGLNSLSLRKNEIDFTVTIPGGEEIAVKEMLSGEMNLLTLLLTGIARYNAKDYDGAIARFTKALEQPHTSQPFVDLTDVTFSLGKSLYHRGKFDEAVKKFQEVILTRESDAAVVSWLGAGLFGTGRYAKAEPLFKRALEIRESEFSQDANVVSTPSKAWRKTSKASCAITRRVTRCTRKSAGRT